MKEKQNSFGFNVELRTNSDDPILSSNDVARARKSDPFTSHESATKITPRIGTIDDLIMKALMSVGDAGLTSDEIVEKTGVKYRSVTPRLKPLMRKGLVVGGRETRIGESGHKNLIWKIRPNE
tara:strand:- start:183 stop:551 length:369 start_codon:yes stop_codon:yes gene_type:complete